jgi:hypothetical protein
MEMVVENSRCFIIMPFSTTKRHKGHTKEYWNKHYNDFLKPLIEQTGLYTVHRSTALTGDIVKQIIYDLIRSPLVVADLTDANSNVYWELGIRQSFENGTITIAEHGTRLPFDLSRKGTHFYNQEGDTENTCFIEGFQRAIRKVFNRECGVDSEILETVSGRGTLYEIMHKYENIRRVQALIEEITENINFLTIMEEALKKQVKAPIAYSSLQNSCLDLLLTQRYLEEEMNIYSKSRHLYLVTLAINSAFSQYKDNWEKLSHFFQTERGLGNLMQKFLDFREALENILRGFEDIK